jgi:phosphatidylserine decarboxylase
MAGAEGATLVRVRATGQLVPEAVFGEQTLHFLYENPWGRRLEQWLGCRTPLNRLYGWLQRAPWTRARIPAYVASLGIDACEAELPLQSYRNLDELFVRRLRPGARTVDPCPDHLLSPCDGRVRVFPRVEQGTLQVKACQVTVAELLGDEQAAARLAGGPAVVIRLAPADYHRFHFPDDGVAGAPRALGGPLHSVHPIALRAGAPSLLNRRTVTWLDSRGFGRLAMVEVGALVVGTIVQSYRPGPVARGQEKGYFRFGGSTVLLLLQPGRLQLDSDLVQTSSEGYETLVRMGSRLGVRP